MTAIAVALLASLLVAVGAFLSAALMHELTTPSRLRRRVRRRQAQLRDWEDDLGERAAFVVRRTRRSLAAAMTRVATPHRRPVPIRPRVAGPSLRP